MKELEHLIRRAVQEELSELANARGGVVMIEPGSPLHNDLKEIARKNKQNKVKVYPRKEVFRDE